MLDLSLFLAPFSASIWSSNRVLTSTPPPARVSRCLAPTDGALLLALGKRWRARSLCQHLAHDVFPLSHLSHHLVLHLSLVSFPLHLSAPDGLLVDSVTPMAPTLSAHLSCFAKAALNTHTRKLPLRQPLVILDHVLSWPTKRIVHCVSRLCVREREREPS